GIHLDLPQLEAGVLQQEQLELHERRHVFEGAIGDDGSYHRQGSVRPRDHGRITRPGVGVLRSTSVEGGCLHRHLQR
ncbi:unnamed protein product, partial [Pylaiella littoralis]